MQKFNRNYFSSFHGTYWYRDKYSFITRNLELNSLKNKTTLQALIWPKTKLISWFGKIHVALVENLTKHSPIWLITVIKFWNSAQKFFVVLVSWDDYAVQPIYDLVSLHFDSENDIKLYKCIKIKNNSDDLWLLCVANVFEALFIYISKYSVAYMYINITTDSYYISEWQ